MTRQQKIDYLSALDSEYRRLEYSISVDKIHLAGVKFAADCLVDEIKMDDLIYFCQTGKYPE